MNVIKVTPRGYCHGVIKALQIVSIAMNDENVPKPIYILGEIVHNKIITNAFKQNNVITLTGNTREKLLDSINVGSVIITAHGTNENVFKKASDKGLNIIDATCKDVYKTHNIIKEKLKNNYDIIYIGKQNHPEPEGVVAINPNKIHLVESKKDIENLNINNNKILITCQTTMSKWDTIKLIDYAKKKYNNIEIKNEICNATQLRQEAIIKYSNDYDLLIVVGDENSNNTNRLAQISIEQTKTKAIRINSLKDLDIKILLDNSYEHIGVTSGASTPTIITTQVIKFLEQFDKYDKKTWFKDNNIDINRIIPRVKKNIKDN